MSKGAFVTVFGVEGKYFDAEVCLIREHLRLLVCNISVKIDVIML